MKISGEKEILHLCSLLQRFSQLCNSARANFEHMYLVRNTSFSTPSIAKRSTQVYKNSFKGKTA